MSGHDMYGLGSATRNFFNTYNAAKSRRKQDKFDEIALENAKLKNSLFKRQVERDGQYQSGLEDAQYDATTEMPTRNDGLEAVGPPEQTPFNKREFYDGMENSAAKVGNIAAMNQAGGAKKQLEQEGFKSLYKGIASGNIEQGINEFNQSGAFRINPEGAKLDKKNGSISWTKADGSQQKMDISDIAALGGVSVAKPDYSYLIKTRNDIYDAKTGKYIPKNGDSNQKVNPTMKYQRQLAENDYKNQTGNFNPGDEIKVGQQSQLSFKYTKEGMNSLDANAKSKRKIEEAYSETDVFLDAQAAKKQRGIFSDYIVVDNEEIPVEEWKASMRPQIANALIDRLISGATMPQSQGRRVPKEAIADLEKDPSPQARKEFDDEYGAGSSTKVLGKPVKETSKPKSSVFGNTDNLLTDNEYKAKKEAERPKTKKELERQIELDILKNAQKASSVAVAGDFGLGDAKTPIEKGAGYNDMAMSRTRVSNAIKKGVQPKPDDLTNAMLFAKIKGDTDELRELEAIAAKYPPEAGR